MSTRTELLAWKRQQLIAESTVQRADLVQQLQPLGYRMASLHTGLHIVERLRRHPGWIVALAAGLMLLKPRRLASLFRLGSAGLRTWRAVAPTLQGLLDNRR